eukprot:jgi/Ulvmu1/5880/UM259_0001.1
MDCGACGTVICTDNECSGSCPENDVCFDVLCYKCGNNPLSCLAVGAATPAQLTGIQGALQANCDADSNQNNPRTCADQQCSTSSPGVIVNLAPNNADGEQCLLSTGNDDPCPCIPNGLSNLGRYKAALQVMQRSTQRTMCVCMPPWFLVAAAAFFDLGTAVTCILSKKLMHTGLWPG